MRYFRSFWENYVVKCPKYQSLSSKIGKICIKIGQKLGFWEVSTVLWDKIEKASLYFLPPSDRLRWIVGLDFYKGVWSGPLHPIKDFGEIWRFRNGQFLWNLRFLRVSDPRIGPFWGKGSLYFLPLARNWPKFDHIWALARLEIRFGR